MEKENDRREYSVLWPLIRYAKSKEETAYRFFPIFTHRETAERLETKSIFYYRYKEKTELTKLLLFMEFYFHFTRLPRKFLQKKILDPFLVIIL